MAIPAGPNKENDYKISFRIHGPFAGDPRLLNVIQSCHRQYADRPTKKHYYLFVRICCTQGHRGIYTQQTTRGQLCIDYILILLYNGEPGIEVATTIRIIPPPCIYYVCYLVLYWNNNGPFSNFGKSDLMTFVI